MMKLQKSNLEMPEVLVKTLRGELKTCLAPNLVEPTLKIWVERFGMKKLDMTIARKTLKLSPQYLEQINPSIGSITIDFTIESAFIYRGEPFCIGAMILLVNQVFKYVKAGKAIDEEATKDLCYMILEDYPYLSFPDLKLCLKNGIKGKYGDIYDRLDVPVIFSWFRQYDEERTRISQKMKQEAHKKRMQEEKGVPMPEAIRKKFEELERKVKAEESEKKEFKPTLSKQIEHLR